MNNKGSEIIEQILEHLEIKAPTLADDIGVKYQRIFDIQQGKTKKISSSVANAIAKRYPQFDVNWLLTGDGKMLKDVSVNAAIGNSQPGVDSTDQINTLMKVVETLSENERTNSKNVAELIAQGRQQTDNITRLIDLLCQKGVNVESLVDKEKGGLKRSGGSGKTSASDVENANVG